MSSDDRPTRVAADAGPKEDEGDLYTLRGMTRIHQRDAERFTKGLEAQLGEDDSEDEDNEEGDVENLQELHLNLLGKVFIAAVGAWVIGKATNLKLRGTQSEIRAVANALQSSRKFQDELRKSGASVQSVMDKLHVKNMSAREFERVFNVKWPL